MHVKTLFCKSDWPFYVALPFFFTPILFAGHDLLQHTNGTFSLPHDEAFLQLSTAKNLAFKRVWGICSFDFAAVSPSLLYPMLLAMFFFIFGSHLLVAILINTVIAIVFLATVQRWLKRNGIPPIVRFFVLVALVLLPPLPIMVMYGLERVLLLLFAFLFVSRLVDEWQAVTFSRRLYLYGVLLVATRYDGALLVLLACLFLLFQRRGRLSLQLGALSLSPVVGFGLLALGKGWYFIPNIFITPPGHFLQSYDWLIGCGIAVTLPLLLRRNPLFFQRKSSFQWITGVVIVVAILLWLPRNLRAIEEATQSSIGLYRQQYLAGQFARRYYRWRGIASDEVGVVSYLAEGRFFDLSGLASIDVAKNRHSLSLDSLRKMSEEFSTQLAIVSDRYTHRLPDSWIKTGSWEIPRIAASGKDVLSFYVVDPGWAAEMKKNLLDYRRHLPGDIIIRF